MPPRSFVSSVYCASPSASSREVVREEALQELELLGPSTWIWPMCETSKTPRSRRTARCSGITPSYWTGMSQPANGTIRAPRATWRSCSGVLRRASSLTSATLDDAGGGTASGEARASPLDRQSSRRKLGISMSASEVVGPLEAPLARAAATGVPGASTRRRRGLPPKPVAITVTRTSSPIDSSITAPKIDVRVRVGVARDDLRRLVDLEQARGWSRR